MHATLVPVRHENTLFAKPGSLNSMLNTRHFGLTEFSGCLSIPFGVCNRTLGDMLISVDFAFAGADWPQSHAVQEPITNDQRVEQHRAEVCEKR